MSQTLSAWFEILEQILGEFPVVDDAMPDWLVDEETGSCLRVDRLYPELGIAVRFKGLPQVGGSGKVTYMKEAIRDTIYARLCRQANITLVVINVENVEKDPPGPALAEIHTALSAFGRRIAQRRVAQDAKLSLIPRIASAKTVCQRISDAVSAPKDLQPFAQAWEQRQSAREGAEALEHAVVESEPEPVSRLEPEPEPAPLEKLSGAFPVRVKERIEFVDILRGFALFGVLVFNMAAFSGQSFNLQELSGGADRVVVALIRFLVEAKFYSLFSLLFGWGMAMQMTRAEARGAKFVPLYLRRLVILLIFGLLHGTLIWHGDILTSYALFGFLLLLFRRRSNKVLLAAVGLALLLSIVLRVPGEAMDAFRTWYGDLTDFLRSEAYPESLFATGSYLGITRRRFQDFLGLDSHLIYYFGNVFGMFLLGLYIGKRRIFQEVDQHFAVLRKMMWIGLAIGAILNGILVSTTIWPTWVPSEYRQLVAVGSRTIGAPALMLFYVTGIILLVRNETWHRRLAPLANVGRSALSNYLLQSIVCTLIFYGYGLGLYGEVGPVFGFILTVIIFFVQIQISEWWFDRYQFGPMEWVWRTLTYGRRQPLRLGETYDDLKPPWPRRIAARVHPVVALVGIWLLLLLWAGGLVFWYGRLASDASQVDLSPIIARATKTAIAAEGVGGSEVSLKEAVAIATPVVQPVAYNPGPIAASGDLLALASTFSAESALAQIKTLTGPPYLGRYAGSPEGWAAGDYIAEQFEKYGLQPAGDDGSFFQAFPVEYVALAAVPGLVVEGPDGTVYGDYVLHQDYSVVVRGYAAAGTASGEVVWASNCTHTDLDALEIVGKIVFCREESIREAGRHALEHGAIGLLLLVDPERRPPDFGSVFFESWVPEPIPVFRVFPSMADELLLGSGKSVEDLSIHFNSFPLATQVRMNVTTTGAEACFSETCQGRNVLGVIPGRDPEYADQVIIIGAHYDHLGQAPDGTVWAGANDDASGVAVLLEIARSWHEQGYVPRCAVLFAAWDAEEMGLIGSGYYVEHPRYPLENTVAEIQLDMVGAGSDTLFVDGKGELAEQLGAVAEGLGIEVKPSNTGGSDHVPFQRARVPSSLLIWFDGSDSVPDFHRPSDIPEVIELDKLDAVGQVVGISVLGLVEGGPAIDDLLARRSAAVESGDLDAFLATSLPEQRAGDHFWFADVQTFSPTRFEMRAAEVRVLGRVATADVEMTLEYPFEGETKKETASLEARFVHGEDGWRWAGPNLVWMDGVMGGLAVAHPPGRETGLVGLGQLAAQTYAEMTSSLGLSTEPDAALLLFPNSKSLWVSTGLSLPRRKGVWVGPGAVKLVYNQAISTSTELTDALAQLVLAGAGVTEAAAPWLWQGLPLALRTQVDPVKVHSKYLPQLQGALAAETVIQNGATSWAAVDYLRQQIGWPGIGEFIIALGQACREGLCAGPDGADLALSRAGQMASSAFEVAWQTHWRDRLAAVQAGLDAVLAARTEAVLAGDEGVFLSTVDSNVPNLAAEEQSWFADLVNYSIESFALTGKPLALLEDGDFLASVTLQYRLGRLAGSRSEATLPLKVLFTSDGAGYRWAGVPFERLQGSRVTVLYPEGREELARALLDKAETIYSQVAATLRVERSDALTVKLYESNNAFRASVSLSFPWSDWLQAWTGDEESVKLQLQEGAALEDYGSTLAVQLARRLLYQMGVDSTWLLKGISLYLARDFDGGLTEQAAAENLSNVLRALSKGRLASLADIPLDYELSEEELGLTNTQAWDAVRYFVYAHGQEALTALLRNQRRGLDPDAVLQSVIGQTLTGFEVAWGESLARAHTLPAWVEIAHAFDPEMAYEHVEVLASPELEGRQAGSPGAEAAAAYIAGKFAEYGLLPAGDPATNGEGEKITFFQRFPISYTTMLAAPRLEVVDEAGQVVEAFVFREHFLTVLGGTGGEGGVTEELVWIRDANYPNINLDGKIALRRLTDTSDIEREIEQAIEVGAGGLILISWAENKKQFLVKNPLPVSFISEGAIPVLELTQDGYSHLLQVTRHTPPSLQNSPPALPLGIKFRLEIPLRVPETVQTANVLGLLPGSDPVLKQKVIILGAHYDHVGDDPDGRRYPGANDDASGVGVLLEIARLWHEMGYRPKHSVLFAVWGAQEMGMLGSRHYVQYPVFPLEKTVTVLQLDAVGGGSGHYMEAQGLRRREGLWLFNMEVAEDLVDGRLKLTVPTEMTAPPNASGGPIVYLSPFDGLAYQLLRSKVSDHVTFHGLGIPALLVAWRGASEDNWPVELAYEVEPYRLGVTGRMVTLATMAIAR